MSIEAWDDECCEDCRRTPMTVMPQQLWISQLDAHAALIDTCGSLCQTALSLTAKLTTVPGADLTSLQTIEDGLHEMLNQLEGDQDVFDRMHWAAKWGSKEVPMIH